MVSSLRRTLLGALVLLAGVWVAWGGFGVQSGGDDPVEFAPAMHALLGGHVGGFFAHLPQDGAGGSVLLRWPAAAVGALISPDRMNVFRFGALGCVLALGILGLVLAAQMPRSGQDRLARASVVGLCLLAPALLGVVRFGHPEEALGAALCVAAVLLAASQRPGAAGVVLGLALVNKPWALLAVAPTLLALGAGRRRCALSAAGITALWVAAVYFAAPGHLSGALAGLSAPPWPADVWWPFTRLRPAPGGIPYRALPPLLSAYGRDLGALAAVAVALPLASRRRARPLGIEQSLALLALSFLVRCAGDPSNLVYYELPFLVALTALEARRGRIPGLSLLAAAGLWLVFGPIASAGSALEFGAYLALTLPFALILGRAAFRTAPRVSSTPACPFPAAPLRRLTIAPSAAPAAEPAR